ncbi:MAG: DUF2232 domain-containing protein [Deltaproteobacteria bacterium]|nr:DUF2232 domain-containing protein [Deltaproteobacteria bacterium]
MPPTLRGNKNLLLLSGIFLLICLFIITIPNLALPLILFLPSVYCIWSEKLPRKWVRLLSLLPLTLIIIPGFTSGVVLYVCILLFSILQCKYIHKGHIGSTVLAPVSMLLGIVVIMVIIKAHILSLPFLEVIRQGIHSMMDQVISVYDQMLTREQLLEFKISRPDIERRIARFFPALISAGLSFVAWANLLIIANIKKISLCHWKGPDWLVYIFICACVMILLPFGNLRIAGGNLLIILCVVYFFQGMAIVGWFLHAHGWSYIIKGAIYILILSQIYIMIIIAGFGLFDTWFEFRKKIRVTKGDGL